MSTPGGRVRSSMSGGGGPQPEFHLRDFSGGMHTYGDREALQDQEMWWCENALPKTAGNLANVSPGSAALASFTDTGVNPIYTMGFNINAVPYVFVAFGGASGTGWIVNLNTFVATKIINSGLTAPYATQYSNTGILIVDPSGYWDYNLTTPATLTSWSGGLAFGTIINQVPATFTVTSAAGGVSMSQVVVSSGGSGGSAQTLYSIVTVTTTAGGTGFAVGDTLDFAGGIGGNDCQIVVTAVGAGGAITGINFIQGGSYGGPTSAIASSIGPTLWNTSGAGINATFSVTMKAQSVSVLTFGNGYTAFSYTDRTVAYPHGPLTAVTMTLSGVTGGTAIATYAGRVWIALGRTVYVTNINSYNNFGGAGLSFTINDSYLYNNITALCSANNYLYIFGITSIDALSNVTVSATTGLTSFTRINIVQGIGTSSPASVFVYYRAVAFFDHSGFYVLNGATPEKISERITAVVTAIQNQSTVNAVYGGVVDIQGELCASFSFVVNDTFSGRTPANRCFTALYFRGRWWMYSMAVALSLTTTPGFASVITANNQSTLFEVGSPTGTTISVYQALGGAGLAPWILRTRLWDGQAILREKQALNAALAAIMQSTGTSGCTFKIDTELADGVTAITFPLSDANPTYHLMVEAAQGGASQYLGITVNGDGTDTTQVKLLALKGKTERSFME